MRILLIGPSHDFKCSFKIVWILDPHSNVYFWMECFVAVKGLFTNDVTQVGGRREIRTFVTLCMKAYLKPSF